MGLLQVIKEQSRSQSEGGTRRRNTRAENGYLKGKSLAKIKTM